MFEKNTTKIMKFKKFLSYFNLRESIKEMELNQILDKVSKKLKLSYGEESFLGKFSKLREDDLISFSMLSRQDCSRKILVLLESDSRVICDLFDRDGKIGVDIKSIQDNIRKEISILFLKNGEKILLKDNFLYNLTYNLKKDAHLLTATDEFFEKIPIRNED